MHPSFLPRPLLRICPYLSLPHGVSYFLTISSYLDHHHMSIPKVPSCLSIIFRPINEVPYCMPTPITIRPFTGCLLAPSSGRVLPSQHVSIFCLVIGSLSHAAH